MGREEEEKGKEEEEKESKLSRGSETTASPEPTLLQDGTCT